MDIVESKLSMDIVESNWIPRFQTFDEAEMIEEPIWTL